MAANRIKFFGGSQYNKPNQHSGHRMSLAEDVPKLSHFLSISEQGREFVSDDSLGRSADSNQLDRLRQARQRSSNYRPQHVKQRRCRSEAGMDSDTGSDGMAVNSGGSGRSGDWGPPRRSQRRSRRSSSSDRMSQPQAQEKCSRPTWYDSGISLSPRCEPRGQNVSVVPTARQIMTRQDRLHSTHAYSNVITGSRHTSTSSSSSSRKTSDTTSPCSLRQSRSRTLSSASGDGVMESEEYRQELSDVQQQVLKLIYGKPSGVPPTRAPVADVSSSEGLSKFPLPAHLDYPLNRYRGEPEKTGKSPMKKIKSGWRKMTSKRAPACNHGMTSSPSAYDLMNMCDVDSDGEGELGVIDSAVILSRLAHDPHSKRGILRRIFGRIGTKSYSTHTFDTDDKDLQQNGLSHSKKNNLHSSSEDISTEFQAHFRPRSNTITKSTSMPILDKFAGDDEYEFPHSHNIDRVAAIEDDPLPLVNSTNAFAYVSFRTNRSSSFVRNHADSLGTSQSPRAHEKSSDSAFLQLPQTSTKCVRRCSSLLSFDSSNERTNSAEDAKLSSAEDSLTNESRARITDQSVPGFRARKSASCYELDRINDTRHGGAFCSTNESRDCNAFNSSESLSEYPHPCCHCCCQCVNPVYFPAPGYPMYGPVMMPYYYPSANHYYGDMYYENKPSGRKYSVPVFPSQPVHHRVDYVGQHGRKSRTVREPGIVAPLNVEVSAERTAARRKVSDMIFDTFV